VISRETQSRSECEGPRPVESIGGKWLGWIAKVRELEEGFILGVSVRSGEPTAGLACLWGVHTRQSNMNGLILQRWQTQRQNQRAVKARELECLAHPSES
jgi:hypothetical protein